MFRTTVVFLILFTSAFPVFAQGVPCSEAEVQHYSPSPDRTQHFSISSDASGKFDATKKVASELGANRWFVTVDPVYSEKPPWNTTIFIGNVGSDKPLLKISILDHGNTLFVKLITDKLLFVEVWWGRFGVSDWIIDIDRQKLVYDELANYLEEHSCTEDPASLTIHPPPLALPPSSTKSSTKPTGSLQISLPVLPNGRPCKTA